MTVEKLVNELTELLPGTKKRSEVLKGYTKLKQSLVESGVSKKIATDMYHHITKG
jgi:lipid A disaccharide synthetase